ncbi:acetyltransferase [Nitrosomonas sp. ANs5]|uniref:acetyltransferase n=1 Tax=Nitrosomonas sp. ANs5 TaxID=3423941 RepID=UPI003D32EBA9
MPDDMRFRNYITADTEALIAVYRAAALVLGRQGYTEEQINAWAMYPEDAEAFRRTLAKGVTLCAVIDGVPAAFGQLHPVDHIAYMYCHPDHARRGLGSAILSMLEAHAQSKGVTAVRVEASAVARPFFERFGYRVLEVERPVRHGVTFMRFKMEKEFANQQGDRLDKAGLSPLPLGSGNPDLVIRAAQPTDYETLLDCWLRSVQATHVFVSANDIQSMIPHVRGYLSSSESAIWVACDASGSNLGFMGLSGNKMEALFLAPEFHGRGIGRQMVRYAQSLHPALTVDVNEQNTAARQFYEACGFVVEGRSEKDRQGRAYPLLHMRLIAPNHHALQQPVHENLSAVERKCQDR